MGQCGGTNGPKRTLATDWGRSDLAAASPMPRLARKVLANAGRSSAASRIPAGQATYDGGL